MPESPPDPKAFYLALVEKLLAEAKVDMDDQTYEEFLYGAYERVDAGLNEYPKGE